MRTVQEISDELDKVDGDASAGGPSKWPGMNYEQGVDAALRWALGWTDETPAAE